MSSKPTFNEKYQAGVSYADTPRPTKANFFADPAKAAGEILKDCVSAGLAISLPELINLIQSLMAKGEPANDRNG